MLIHVLLAIPGDPQRERFERLLRHPEILLRRAGDEGRLRERISGSDFDLLVIDHSMLPSPVESLPRAVRELPDRPEVVVLTERDDAEERAALLAHGCLAVLSTALGDAALRNALSALIERRREEAINRLRAERPEERYSLNDFVSDSPTMQVFLELARKVVRADTSLLLLGETGVGKERMARAIHAEGPRSSGPFLAINCGALPESLLESELFGHEEGAFTGATRAHKGYFELAHRGTLFLDEIGEMPLHLQVKLLRVLDEHRIQRVGGERPFDVDVRVMAATNRDLEAAVSENAFRSDLYYRLAVVTLQIPPLRERREDIRPLAESYLEHFRNQTGRPVSRLGEEAIRALERYDWPGNVRELVNAVERAVLIAGSAEIGLADLSDRIAGRRDVVASRDDGLDWSFAVLPERLRKRPLPQAKREVVAAFERAYLAEALRSSGGRVGETARRSGVNERSLYQLMKKHRLKKESFRSGR